MPVRYLRKIGFGRSPEGFPGWSGPGERMACESSFMGKAGEIVRLWFPLLPVWTERERGMPLRRRWWTLFSAVHVPTRPFGKPWKGGFGLLLPCAAGLAPTWGPNKPFFNGKSDTLNFVKFLTSEGLRATTSGTEPFNTWVPLLVFREGLTPTSEEL